MKFEIITAGEAYKLTEKKRGGVPPDAIDEALRKIDLTIKTAAGYDGLPKYTFDTGQLFLSNTGVKFSDDAIRIAVRKVARTLQKAGYKVFLGIIDSSNTDQEDFTYHLGMTVTWYK